MIARTIRNILTMHTNCQSIFGWDRSMGVCGAGEGLYTRLERTYVCNKFDVARHDRPRNSNLGADSYEGGAEFTNCFVHI